MLCNRCGKEIPEGSAYCNFCGKKQNVERKNSRRPNGTGTAYKRGKTWTAMIIRGYYTKNGKLVADKQTKGGFRTKADALNYCGILSESKASKLSKQTFRAIYDEWIEWYEPKKSKSTINCYKAAIRFFEPIFGYRFLDVTTAMLQECIEDCENGRRTKENMKATASLMYQYAIFHEIISINKAEQLDVTAEKSVKVPPITLEELEIIKASDELYAPYVVFLCYTGCRPNELFKIRKGDYDPEHRCIITGSKTEAGMNRIITLSPKIIPIIEHQLTIPGEFLFPTLDEAYFGKQMTVNNFARKFKVLMEKLSIKDRVPYSCRHTFSNLLKAVKGSDTDKSSLMGHAQVYMTKYYQSADYESMRKITDNL